MNHMLLHFLLSPSYFYALSPCPIPTPSPFSPSPLFPFSYPHSFSPFLPPSFSPPTPPLTCPPSSLRWYTKLPNKGGIQGEKDVSIDVILSLPMFLRLYLICRVMLLHSKVSLLYTAYNFQK